MAKASLDHSDIEIIRHTIGFHSEGSDYGWRNFYCTEVGDAALESLVSRGLMSRGGTINEGRDRYYRATRAGVLAVDLDPNKVDGIPKEQSPSPDPNYSTADLEAAGQEKLL